MDIHIRLEQPADYRAAEEVMREAFWNCYSPGCTEHYLLHIMRDSPAFIPELDFVAESEGRIVGSVVFLKSFIHGDDGRRYEVLSMGPIAVLPSYQRKGVGRMLIEYARGEAAAKGYRAILLCGEPRYYTKTGFTAAEEFGIRTAENKYFAALHLCPLYPGALTGITGKYYEDAIYDVNADKAEAFDKSFPKKERLEGTPTQRRFEEVLAMHVTTEKRSAILSFNEFVSESILSSVTLA